MAAVDRVRFDLRDDSGRLRGRLTIATLPQGESLSTASLLDLRSNPAHDPALEPIQLLEGCEYRYQVEPIEFAGSVSFDPSECFAPDTHAGLTGRLRPGLYTGRLPINVHTGQMRIGQAAVEVRSRKLDYLQHYRWMLHEIASEATELVMQRFAPAQQRFKQDAGDDAATLYQRFMFLQALIAGPDFDAAWHHVVARPHRDWANYEEQRHPGRGVPSHSSIHRQMLRPGPRLVTQDRYPVPIHTLPSTFVVTRSEETLDTVPNRFVKFAMTRWRGVVAAIEDSLRREPPTSLVERGLREVRSTLGALDAMLAARMFAEVGELKAFPSDNQVLQKRTGYRFFMKAYVQFELAAQLAWQGGEDVYGAGQRNVAALYEYWVFLRLAKLVARLSDQPFSLTDWIQASPGGLALQLQRGRSRKLEGAVVRRGRRLRLTLWFNRSFERSNDGTWSVPMQPDYSLKIVPEYPIGAEEDEIWLHFDAKYRVEEVTKRFGDDRLFVEEEESEPADRRARRLDVIKMHAYRDAIRRSSGAYVLYPGDEGHEWRAYHELLPGLGAFIFKPAAAGDVADGESALERFLNDVLDQLASQLTQHERARYWSGAAFGERVTTSDGSDAVPFLTRPPADTIVLVGYVRSASQWQWIERRGLYNLRADGRTGSVGVRSRELAAELVLLYSGDGARAELWRVSGTPQIYTKARMRAEGYPGPRGELYFCLPVERISEAPIFDAGKVRRIVCNARTGAPVGAPMTAVWSEVVSAV